MQQALRTETREKKKPNNERRQKGVERRERDDERSFWCDNGVRGRGKDQTWNRYKG